MEFADTRPRNISKKSVASSSSSPPALLQGGKTTMEETTMQNARSITSLNQYNRILFENGLLSLEEATPWYEEEEEVEEEDEDEAAALPSPTNEGVDPDLASALSKEQLHRERLTHALAFLDQQKAVLARQETIVKEADLAVQGELQGLINAKDILACLRATYDTQAHASFDAVETADDVDRDKYGVIHWGNTVLHVPPAFDFDRSSNVADAKLKHDGNISLLVSEVFESFLAERQRDEWRVSTYLEGLFSHIEQS